MYFKLLQLDVTKHDILRENSCPTARVTSKAEGTEVARGSSSSGEPPMKNLLRLEIHDRPAGRQQWMFMRNTPGEPLCNLMSA